jgi:pimeloyl-ACP methyl ester carboxylesterase
MELQSGFAKASAFARNPAWQEYFRTHQPPVLIAWGAHDEIFPAAGAEPYKRDLKTMEYHLLNAGHFALETNRDEIAGLMRDFLGRHLSAPGLIRAQAGTAASGMR